MKLVLLTVGAAAVMAPAQPAPNGPIRPEAAIEVFGTPEPADCADRIERVRDDLAQPKLDRSPASAEQPLLIAAVDKRVDGCSVLQMHGAVNDLRPVPQNSNGPLLQPAR